MQQTMVGDVWMWKRWQPDRSMDFNSFFVRSAGGNLAIDPLEPDAEDVAWVIVTNRDHERATTTFVERFGAKVAASEHDAGDLSVPVARRLKAGEIFEGWHVIGLEGFKSPGEIALYSPERRTVVLGDSLWGDPAGALKFGAQKKIDLPRASVSIRAILDVPKLDHLLVGDGVCVFRDARNAVLECVEAPGAVVR
jgi:glyoxylase-like metal-dependent hydrolase (beta-lactamase superfamily II)